MNEVSQRAGRPLEFDPDRALWTMLTVFWERGYDNTSVSDLEEATGLARPSLYNTFGNKRAIYEASIDAYLDEMVRFVDEHLVDRTAGLDDLAHYVSVLTAEFYDATHAPGCAMVNDIAAHGDRNEFSRERARRYGDTLREGLATAASRAARLDEIDTGDVELVVDRMQVYLVGLNVLARSADSLERIDAHATAIRTDIASWRREQDTSTNPNLAGDTNAPLI